MKYLKKITAMICLLFLGFGINAQTDGTNRAVIMDKTPPRTFEARSVNDTSKVESIFPIRTPQEKPLRQSAPTAPVVQPANKESDNPPKN